MCSLVSWMEKSVLSNLKNISNNQYLMVKLEHGDVKSCIPFSRTVGFVTFGLSSFFTTPFVVVEGPRTPKNRACLKRLENGLPCRVVDHLEAQVGPCGAQAPRLGAPQRIEDSTP